MTTPAGADLLLHVCCGPCALAVVEDLRGSGYQPVPYFHNPNIHPLLEFLRRLEAFELACQYLGLDPEAQREYGLDEFLHAVGSNRANRCAACVDLRLGHAARAAAERGLSQFTTTLLISIYQDHEQVRAAGTEAGEAHGVEFVYRDFRPLFRQGQEKARQLGLYCQPYCGCIFSEAERYAGRLKG